MMVGSHGRPTWRRGDRDDCVLPPVRRVNNNVSAKMTPITVALVSLSLTCSALAAPVLTQDFGHFHLDVAAAKVHKIPSS